MNRQDAPATATDAWKPLRDLLAEPDTRERTRAVNLGREPWDVYIGRENKKKGLPESKWGNPFHIGRDGTRKEVIAKYRVWLATQPKLLAALDELRGKRLGCYCKPLACHGDVLAVLAEAGAVEPPTA